MPPYEYSAGDVYVVEFFSSHQGGWTSYPEFVKGSEYGVRNKVYVGKRGFTVALPFPASNLKGAIETIVECRDKPGWRSMRHRIIQRHTGAVVWTSEDGTISETDTSCEYVVSVTITPQEAEMSDVAQPLHIPRTALIEALNTRLDEEKKAREDADAAATARRQSLVDTVAKLSSDQVTNILSHYVNDSTDGLTKWVEDKVEEKKFVSKALEVTPTENRIEKYVRVLTLASDDQIEVAPSDPIYPLL